ncbi:Retrovirus-related Pol polyprotein from transposon opus [Stylophora pistillata]|uniref:Retrovirus-related Pol polyprotein from transposon opus n=1 Tax=Stylophora pistillata TaxID=50429 RepID=A0A2B4SUM1_STYPI|nr:Retrovirus-related Pol polyprotein from transposon opus [Stylophora pistillata]
MFGINAASEIFQNAIKEILTGLPGCQNISDDIVVYGKTQKKHDENLRGVLERLQQHGVRLNKEKCTFSRSEIKFYGQIFSKNGVKADPAKIKGIIDMSKPESVSKKDKAWQWADEQQRAFNKLKDSLTKNHVMSYFNPRLKTEVIVDASPVGLGGFLVQDSKVISYASRALSDVESRYSQTEREMLGVVWAVENFHLYLYGSEFIIATDHKSLLGIFNSHKPTSAHIDRWKLRLMPYNCQLIYRPGEDAENPADFMSRHPSDIDSEGRNIAEDYVNYVCNQAVPKAMTLQEIKLESEKDILLQAFIKAIETDQWTHPKVQDYRNVKDELLVYQVAVLRGNRIVFPKVLSNYQQGRTTRTSKDDTATKRPMERTCDEFLGPLPSGEYLMVVIDKYSRFPEVEIVTSTSARSTILKLDAIFAKQGIPDVLKSDNGPPFNGKEFKNFAEHLGKNGSMVTASDGNKTVTRNSSMFKVVPSHIRHAEKITQEQADEDLTAEPWSPEVSELDKSSSSPSPTTALWRSQRQTRLPAKLKDFVLFVR